MYYIGASDIDTALNEKRLSIYQDDTEIIIDKINI
jgi:hypothetical protein